jgi:pimeloyl-ACP methyl ester carboxylesterase
VVVGLSSGAALVLEAAARGVPMRCAVAFEAPYMVGAHRLPQHERFQGDLAALVANDDRDGAVKLFMRTVGVPAFALPIMRIMPMWKDLRGLAHTLPYDAAVMQGFELPAARLAGIRVPTLVLGGGRSPANLKAAVRAVVAAIPGATFVELPKQSHNVSPAALVPSVHDFAAGLQTRDVL